MPWSNAQCSGLSAKRGGRPLGTMRALAAVGLLIGYGRSYAICTQSDRNASCRWRPDGALLLALRTPHGR